MFIRKLEDQVKVKKIKIRYIILIIVLLVILGVAVSPLIRYNIFKNNYQLFGSYMVSENDKNRMSEIEIINLKSQQESYTKAKVTITNILYYNELAQLSFGLALDNDGDKTYEINVYDSEHNEIGTLMTEGKRYFYNRSIERVHLYLGSDLIKDDEYYINVFDDKDNLVVTSRFKYVEKN